MRNWLQIILILALSGCSLAQDSLSAAVSAEPSCRALCLKRLHNRRVRSRLRTAPAASGSRYSQVSVG